MKAFGRWSIVSLLRFIVQFAWVIVLAFMVMTAIIFIISIVTGNSLLSIGFPVYLDPQPFATSLKESIESGSVLIQSVSGIEATYASYQVLSVSSVILGLSQIGLMGYTLYALSVLKRPLNAMALNRVFEPENGKDLKKVALLLLLASPLIYGYEWLSRRNFETATGMQDGLLSAPPFDFTLLLAGSVCFLFAEVVTQAAILFEEQKLTV